MSDALELAEILEQECLFSGIARREHLDYRIDAATELRRLDALVKEQAQEIERLMAQRVPAHGAGAGGRLSDGCCHKTVLKPCDGCPYAVKAVHGIHPLQRLVDLSKEIGEKL